MLVWFRGTSRAASADRVFAHSSSGPIRTPQRSALISTDFLGVQLSDSHFLLVGFNFYFCAQPHIERVQYTDRAFQRDSEVFITLVA